MTTRNEYQDTIPVRVGEALDYEKLSVFLNERFGFNGQELQIKQFGTGHSNLTYELKVGGLGGGIT